MKQACCAGCRLGMLGMKRSIWLQQLCVATRRTNPVAEQKENYARQILMKQQEQGWEGVTTEVANICLQAGLPNFCKKLLIKEDKVKALKRQHLKEMEMEPL